MDKVILTSEAWESLKIWRDKNADLVRDYHPVIMEGNIEINGNALYFCAQDGYVRIEVKNLFHCILEIVPRKGYIVHEIMSGNENVIKDTVTVYFTVMAYIYNFKPEIEVREFHKHKGSGKGKRGNSQAPYTVTLKRTVYIIPEHIKTTRRPSQRIAEAWSVRGHMRRLGNGKIVRVKPYTKGNGRIAEKTYRLEDL